MLSSTAKVNPDLAKEREKASFNPTELTYLLHGGRQKIERKRYLESLLVNDPIFSKEDAYVCDRKHQYERCCQKGLQMLELHKEYNITDEDDIRVLNRLSGTYFPYDLSNAMFIPTIKSQGTPEQKAKWLPLAESYQIIGTYAQTELGHGTFIRGLETTATYDKKTQEFVIHSPSLSASKWWPGNLGKSSNFAIVVARLIVDAKDHGIQMFIVQLRDLNTHQPLPGITIGEIGPKFSGSLDPNDNGFLLLDHVRIPLNQMLMGLAKLSPDGTLTKPANSKLLYGTMSFVRAQIVISSFHSLSQALTIAIRYSAVRRQGKLRPGCYFVEKPVVSLQNVGCFFSDSELQVIDYKTQQYKLIPGLAMAYATRFAFDHVWSLYHETQKQIRVGNLSMLPQLHAFTSGLKAYCTSTSMHHAETCRLACGGHGYLLSSGLPTLYSMINAACTYEGDNDVLYLQVARYLVKIASNLQKGEAPPESLSFFLQNPELCPATKACEFLDPKVQRRIYQDRTTSEVKSVAEKLQNKVISGMDSIDAWNDTSIDLVHCAKGYSHCVMVIFLLESIEKLSSISRSLHTVLKSLADLFVLHGITENSGSFIEPGILNEKQLQTVRQQVYNLINQLRPEAVALVDAFDYSDFVLNSPLGRYDGNVYEALFKYAQKAALNDRQVQPAYYKYLRPLMRSQKSKL